MISKIKQKIKNQQIKRAQKREARFSALQSEFTAYDEAILAWVAPEMIKHERGLSWKIIVSFLIALAFAWGFVYGSWTFSLALLMALITYYIAHLEHPRDVQIKISEIGVKAGTRKYPYSRIRAFWVIYEPHVKTLNLRISGDIISDITIQLGTQNPAIVRNFLLEKIPELEGQTEKISDIFIRLFKI